MSMLGKRKTTGREEAVMEHEGCDQGGNEAARRKGLKKAAPQGKGPGGSFGDVLQKALNRKIPTSKGAGIGSEAKGNMELKNRIKEDKAAKEEKRLLAEKRKWFQKEHVIPVFSPLLVPSASLPWHTSSSDKYNFDLH